MQIRYKYKGFTLLEILLIITLIGILSGIALIAINPNRQLGQVRDLGRQDDITEIQQALEMYATRNSGEYPAGLADGPYREICGDVATANCVDLSVLVPNYLTSIPKDPNGNSYLVGIHPENKNISVWAQNAEQREVAINKYALAATIDKTADTGIPLGFNNTVNSITLQPDGKILVGGEFTSYQGVAANRIVRLNVDATRDNSFNAVIDFDYSGVNSIVLQSDGKILLGGWFYNYQGGGSAGITSSTGMIRLNTDGSRDMSFNSEGVFLLDVNMIAIQNDGKILGVGLYSIARLNSDGTRDTSFNVGAGLDGDVNAIAIQSDGKVLVGGGFTTYQGVAANRIVQLNSNGTRDTNFNVGAGLDGDVNAIAIQSDGKVLVGGWFSTYQGLSANRIIRLNSNGDRDTSFNVGSGFSGVLPGQFTDSEVVSLTVQPNGKILVGGGFGQYQGVVVNGIVRLNSNGDRDSSFNVETGFTGTYSGVVNTIIIKNNDKILVGGSFISYKEKSISNIIILNSDASVDTFDYNSVSNTGFNTDVDTIAIQSDGKILVGGKFTTYQRVAANRIVRLNIDGTRDNSFNISTGFDSYVNTIAIQSDGKILVGGKFTTYQGSSANRIIRLNIDGTRDTNFDIGVGFSGGTNDGEILNIAIQSDGKILAVGGFINYKGLSANRIIRLNSDGTRDSSFNMGTGFSNVARSISIQSDGKIVVGGEFTSYQGVSANKIIRLNSDGTRDTSFNIGTGFNNSVTTLALQSDGKIVAGGGFTSYNGTIVNRIVRLNSDGTRDTSFNIGTGFDGGVLTLALQSDGKIVVGGRFTVYQGQSAGYLIRLYPDDIIY